MNKLKNVFQRSQKPVEERRPHQFIKRLSSANPTTPVDASPEQDGLPAINLFDLSEMERQAYQSWWKDLDPFGHGKIDNQTTMRFLNGCILEDTKLEQILALFEAAGDGLNQLQFFAMLRLIAHAQSGRKVSKALVYLGAPVPHFRTNAIDALIKSDVSRTDKNKMPERASWWGTEMQQPPTNRRSYHGQSNTRNTVPDIQQGHLYPTYNDLWPTPSAPPLLHQTTHKSEHTHSRSKSAGNAIHYTQPLDMQPQLQPSRSSLSLHELNSTGNSLLLTQEFIYQSPSSRQLDLPQSVQEQPSSFSNPFNSVVCSPFDDENNTDEIILESNPIITHNNKPNTDSIPPPPVPCQATKPAFPKYARSTFLNQDLLQ